MNHAQKIGAEVRKARLKAGISQTELARRLGNKQSNISNIEYGVRNTSIQMLSRISKALNQPITIPKLLV